MNRSHLIWPVYTRGPSSALGRARPSLILAKWKKHPLVPALHYRFFSLFEWSPEVLKKPSSITNTSGGGRIDILAPSKWVFHSENSALAAILLRLDSTLLLIVLAKWAEYPLSLTFMRFVKYRLHFPFCKLSVSRFWIKRLVKDLGCALE